MMMVEDALKIASRFLIYDLDGPSGELGSFDPVSAEYDEEREIWIVVATFRKDDETRTAKVRIDKHGRILGFETAVA